MDRGDGLIADRLARVGLAEKLYECTESDSRVLSIPIIVVNKQGFLQVFQGSGIGEIEDNSIRPATIMIPGRPGKLSERLLTCKSPLHNLIFISYMYWGNKLILLSTSVGAMFKVERIKIPV